jgi:hypothetical protein
VVWEGFVPSFLVIVCYGSVPQNHFLGLMWVLCAGLMAEGGVFGVLGCSVHYNLDSFVVLFLSGGSAWRGAGLGVCFRRSRW